MTLQTMERPNLQPTWGLVLLLLKNLGNEIGEREVGEEGGWGERLGVEWEEREDTLAMLKCIWSY